MKHTMKKRMITAAFTASLLLGSVSASIPTVMAAQSATVDAGVNFRSAPSASAPVIRMLKKGEQVTILDASNAYWYKLQDSSGRTGYASPSYFTVSSVSSSHTATGTIQKSVSFRTSASLSASRIRFLQAGEQVAIISRPNSSWYEIRDSSGQAGYVSSQPQYISVSGSSGGSGGSSGTTAPSTGSVESVIAAGLKYLGTPYEYGSSRSTTTTFDCSDLVRQAFLEGVGIKLPADSRGQGEHVAQRGKAVTDWRQLKRGDIMFFMSYKGSKASAYSGTNKSTATITHDGIYLGDGKILHTYSNESGGVTISSIAGTHWEYRFLYGGSAL
ncbi:C40 family peptidase [Paenibacillus algorifonticola]|uniref:C40 family peptidase n=1 Tax=Paenibacillus algorifonticola TaxID=684063 RepID=UPI001E57A1A5|nr:C40 family peptidase [Paenibacillus algorifonticola]